MKALIENTTDTILATAIAIWLAVGAVTYTVTMIALWLSSIAWAFLVLICFAAPDAAASLTRDYPHACLLAFSVFPTLAAAWVYANKPVRAWYARFDEGSLLRYQARRRVDAYMKDRCGSF